jgi:hypothetical protein
MPAVESIRPPILPTRHRLGSPLDAPNEGNRRKAEVDDDERGFVVLVLEFDLERSASPMKCRRETGHRF